MSGKINWSNWVAIAGVAWLASAASQAAPTMQAQGGLSVEQWLQALAPLLAFIPKVIDSWKRDKDLTARAIVALGGVQVARDFLGPNDPAVVDAVKVLRAAIVAKLEPLPTTPKVEVSP